MGRKGSRKTEKARRRPVQARPRLRRRPRVPRPPAPAERSEHGIPVVGIGASAGGLEACSEFLRHIAGETGLAFVLVQHLDPAHESRLPEILSKSTSMPVVAVTDRLPVRPDHVYVIPPNVSMALKGDVLRLTPRAEATRHLPIDSFFGSLARERRSRAIGVVLSGTGTDGTRGLQAIKEGGGVTLVQEERSAKHGGMPHSAIAAGLADHILAPAQIAREIVRMARHFYLRSAPAPRGGPRSRAQDTGVGDVLRAVLAGTGVNFAEYKAATIRRRIARRMLLKKFDDVGAYADHLWHDAREVRALHDDLLIQVTGFFRDASGIESLARRVFPSLLRKRPADTPIRIWVPGCATGEEAYSLVIALLEFLDERKLHVPVQVFATDLSTAAIARARAARYPEAIAADVAPGRLRRFFVKTDGVYQLSKRVREACVFAPHDLTRDPPFAALDLISCSNVLIYLSESLQDRTIRTFHYALKPHAFLKLGPSEGVGRLSHLFDVVDRRHKVFARRPGATGPFAVGITASRLTAVDPIRTPTRLQPGRADVEREADRVVMGRYAPSGVIVNGDLEIVQVRGRTGPFLEATPGSASLSLFRMVREGLEGALRRTLRRARRERRAVTTEGVRFKTNGKYRTVNVEVVPIGEAAQHHYLILFVENAPSARSAVPRGRLVETRRPAVRGQQGQLARDLATTRQRLQITIDEQEAANEELQAATEEAQSANEELQSTNEELETAKEELQATNEELTTVNEELYSRNTLLSQLSSDLTNLLHSIHVPILMVGADHRLRSITPVAERVLRIAPSDVGRPISDLRLSIDVSDLEGLLAEVAATLVPQEREVQARDGRWYSVRVRPYRTSEDRIDGAVISFVDVDALRRALDQLMEARDQARAIVETVQQPLVLLDDALKVVTANRSFYATFQVSPDQTEGRAIFDLGNRQWDMPALRRLLQEVLQHQRTIEEFEVQHRFETIGLRTMRLNARRLRAAGDRLAMILLAIEDVTEAKRLEAAQDELRREQIARAEAEAATQAKDRFLAVLSHELRTPLNAMLGWTRILRSQPLEAAMVTRGLEVIERNVATQVRLIEDLLDVSRIIAGRLRLDVRSLMVAPIVQAVVAAARPAAEAKQIVLEVALDESAGPVRGDPARLQQILQNLLDNAVKFTPPGGRVDVVLNRTPSAVEIRVRDTGEGMPPERLADLWSPHRVPSGEALTRSGLGIGLTIVRTLVGLHGGAVKADSAGPGQGATFTVTLPLTEEAPAQVAPPPGLPARQGRARTRPDSMGFGSSWWTTRPIRGSWRGPSWHAAAPRSRLWPTRRRLDALDRARFDVLISDLAMPDRDGYELIRIVRERAPELGGRIPAVALFAYARGEDRTQAIAAGYDRFLAKPVEPTNLVSAVAALAALRRSLVRRHARVRPARRGRRPTDRAPSPASGPD